MRSHMVGTMTPRNAFRLRRAESGIRKLVRLHPGLVAFPILRTRDPDDGRQRKAKIIGFPGNLARAPIAQHRDNAA